MNLVLYNPPSSANKKPILPMSLLAIGALLEKVMPDWKPRHKLLKGYHAELRERYL